MDVSIFKTELFQKQISEIYTEFVYYNKIPMKLNNFSFERKNHTIYNIQ